MAGKRTYDADTHDAIRAMRNQGARFSDIAKQIGCSIWTIRCALRPDFAESERQRHRDIWPDRREKRGQSEDFAAYRAAYFSSDEWRERARQTMREIRARRRVPNMQ